MMEFAKSRAKAGTKETMAVIRNPRSRGVWEAIVDRAWLLVLVSKENEELKEIQELKTRGTKRYMV